MRVLRRTPALMLAVLAVAAGLAVPSPASAATAPIQPVASVDLQRYTGTWRQIADIPQFYEAFCVKDVTATYSINPDGTVKVANRCTGPFGTTIPTNGTARVLDPTSNAVLQVTFLSFLGTPVFSGSTPNYVIIGLGSDYSWAVVGSPDRSTAYVLSRTATLTPDRLAAAKDALARSGYDPCSLTVSRQTGGATTTGPLC